MVSDDKTREERLTALAVIELALRLIDEGAEGREEELDAVLPDPGPDPRMVALEAASILVTLIDTAAESAEPVAVSRRVLRELLRQERESVLAQG